MMYNDIPEQRLEPRENRNEEEISNLLNMREEILNDIAELNSDISDINSQLNQLGVE